MRINPVLQAPSLQRSSIASLLFQSNVTLLIPIYSHSLGTVVLICYQHVPMLYEVMSGLGKVLLPCSLIQSRDLLVPECDPFSKGEKDFLPVLWTPGAGSLPVFLIAYGRKGSCHALIPPIPSPHSFWFPFHVGRLLSHSTDKSKG